MLTFLSEEIIRGRKIIFVFFLLFRLKHFPNAYQRTLEVISDGILVEKEFKIFSPATFVKALLFVRCSNLLFCSLFQSFSLILSSWFECYELKYIRAMKKY